MAKINYYKHKHDRICDVENGATNTENYIEFLFNAWRQLGLTENQKSVMKYIDGMSEFEFNEAIEEADWLLEK